MLAFPLKRPNNGGWLRHDRLAEVAGRLVPFMALAYVTVAGLVIATHLPDVPGTLAMIVTALSVFAFTTCWAGAITASAAPSTCSASA